MDPHGLDSMVGHDAKLRGKHQGLLQEYLVLQKEEEEEEKEKRITRGKQKIEKNQKSKGSQIGARALSLKIMCSICKECVLKKRKLNESNERKITLLDEIRFLKQRRDLLLKQQYQNSEQTQESAGKTNAETSRRYLSGTPASTSTSGQAFHHPRPPMIPISKMGSGSGSKEEAAFAPLNLRKKAKSLFNNGKRAEKRKISWQDQLALKV